MIRANHKPGSVSVLLPRDLQMRGPKLNLPQWKQAGTVQQVLPVCSSQVSEDVIRQTLCVAHTASVTKTPQSMGYCDNFSKVYVMLCSCSLQVQGSEEKVFDLSNSKAKDGRKMKRQFSELQPDTFPGKNSGSNLIHSETWNFKDNLKSAQNSSLWLYRGSKY